MGDVLSMYEVTPSFRDLQNRLSPPDFYLQLWVNLHGLSGTLAFYTVRCAHPSVLLRSRG